MARVKNWANFQHFKDRRPPWIKLYRDILDDVEWHELSGDEAKTLIMVWLIASENNGDIPDSKVLAFRLRMTVKQVDSCLSKLSHWVETERYQGDISASQINSVAEVSDHQERETEEEKEREVETEIPASLLKDFLAVRKAKKAGPLTKTALAGIAREADKAGITLIDAVTACCEYGWQGFNASWFNERRAGNSSAAKGGETAFQRSMRERYEEATGSNKPAPFEVLDISTKTLEIS